MKLALVLTLSTEFDGTPKNFELAFLNEQIKAYFKGRNYGESVDEFLVGLVCVHPKYAPFFTIRKPRYTEDKYVTYEKVFGAIHYFKILEVDVKLDFGTFIKSDKEGGLKMVADAIIDRLSTMKYPAKVKDFDKERSLNDLKIFFKEEISYNPSH